MIVLCTGEAVEYKNIYWKSWVSDNKEVAITVEAVNQKTGSASAPAMDMLFDTSMMC